MSEAGTTRAVVAWRRSPRHDRPGLPAAGPPPPIALGDVPFSPWSGPKNEGKLRDCAVMTTVRFLRRCRVTPLAAHFPDAGGPVVEVVPHLEVPFS